MGNSAVILEGICLPLMYVWESTNRWAHRAWHQTRESQFPSLSFKGRRGWKFLINRVQMGLWFHLNERERSSVPCTSEMRRNHEVSKSLYPFIIKLKAREIHSLVSGLNLWSISPQGLRWKGRCGKCRAQRKCASRGLEVYFCAMIRKEELEVKTKHVYTAMEMAG